MTLPAAEKKWLEERLKTYQIKYREIYYEILDHVILSVEQKRAAGDSTDISILFQQVVDGQFGVTRALKTWKISILPCTKKAFESFGCKVCGITSPCLCWPLQ